MKSELTQIARTKVSAPTQFIVDNCYVYGDVLHFGEGKAFKDTDALQCIPAVDLVQPYDPFSPVESKHDRSVVRGGCKWDYSIANYVLNTLTAGDREDAFMDAFYASLYSVYTVRLDKVQGTPYQDGVITSRGTFQTQLSPEEWICWFYDTLYARTASRYRVKILNKTRSYLMVEVW